MRCPKCESQDDKVIDSRSSRDGATIRRRRECLQCGARFTTYEEIEKAEKLKVLKRDGSSQDFSREKLLLSLERACYKRPVSGERLRELVDKIDGELATKFGRDDIPFREIGEKVMSELRALDKVAYIR